MTRAEQKKEKLKQELEFLKNKDKYYSECFIKNDDFYKMIEILKSAENHNLTKEYGFELHHGVPRSYFKKKNKMVIDKNNLYKLTYSEHFMVHYYAYKCATPLLKPSMTLAMIQMKRVCNKNTTEHDTLELSKIFESIKLDLYKDKNRDAKIKTFKQAKEKLEERTCGNFELISAERIHDFSNDRLQIEFKCKECGKLFLIKTASHFFSQQNKFICDCKRGYQESVSVLIFGINKDKKAEWYISKVSYSESMKKRNAFITKSYVKQQLCRNSIANWVKYSIIDIKPEGYVWCLDENRKYNPFIRDCITLNDFEKDFVNNFWDCEYVSNKFFLDNLSHSAETTQESMKLKPRRFICNKQVLFRVDYSEEELSKSEWEHKLNKSWYKILKEHTVTKVPMFHDLFDSLMELKKKSPDMLDFIFSFMEFILENNVPEDMIDEMFDGICDYKKELRKEK